jgi:Xaa-Pro aminopeptidase
VHEGPQNISKRPIPQALKPGMLTSNEPGYYKAGEYGIRIENLIVTQLCAEPGDRGMMEFETITLAPIDIALIEPKLMTEAERSWLNSYHARVREVLSPLVDAETKAWLAHATREI